MTCVLVPIATMSSSDEEAQSPELGASSSKAPVTPTGSPDDSGDEDDGVEVESEPESEEEEQTTKKRTRVKDTREWNLIAKWSCADHEPEEIEGLLFTECKKLMEVTGCFVSRRARPSPATFFCGSIAQNGTSGRAPLSIHFTIVPCSIGSVAIARSRLGDRKILLRLKCAAHTI